MLEPIEVVARFDEHGKVHPLSLRWQGRNYLVEAAGRRWQAADGLHILILTPSGRAFEVRFQSGENLWFMVQAPSDRLLA